MKHGMLILIFAIVGCAAEVGKDNSKEIQAENTNLKIQLTKVQIDRDQLAKQSETNQHALEACYSRAKQ